MKKLFGLSALLVLFALPTLAQDTDTPVFEVGGGYAYRSFNVPAHSRLNMNGWELSGDYNVNNWLGVAGEFDGTRSDTGGLDWVYSYTFGPQFYPVGHHRLTPYVNFLLGGAHYSLSGCGGGGCSFTQNSFAFGGGGGLDLTLTSHIAARLGQLEYERTSFFDAGSNGNPYQQNFKFSMGLIVRFGQK